MAGEKTKSTTDNLDSNEEEKESLLSDSELSDSSPEPSRSSSPEPETKPQDARFTQPPVSRFKRTSLLIFLALLFWIAYSMRANLPNAKRKPKIVHASRYSKDHKFRPAASPIITETLKDGRIRLRGALPTSPPVLPVVKNKKPSTGKVSGKRKKSGTKFTKHKTVNQRRM